MSKFSRSSLALALLAALPAVAQTPVEDEGKKAVDGTCNTCHPLSARVGTGYDEKGWDTVLRMMTNHGAPVNAEKLPAMKAKRCSREELAGRGTGL